MPKDYSPIHVNIPSPWRSIVKFSGVFSWVLVFGFAWRLFIFPEPPDDVMVAHAVIAFICGPFLFLYCIPGFLGYYPSWVIRILGRKYILRLISDCEKHVGNQRKEKGKLSEPSSWLKDQRIFWLGFVLCCFVIGLIAGLST